MPIASLRDVSLTSTLEESLIIEPITKVIAISKLSTDVSEMTLQRKNRMFMFAQKKNVYVCNHGKGVFRLEMLRNKGWVVLDMLRCVTRGGGGQNGRIWVLRNY